MKKILRRLAAVAAVVRLAAAAPLPGQLMLDPENPHALIRQGGGHVFICGPGDPEDFLYRGTRAADGTRRGDQVALIEKLARHGGNSIYMQAVRTHGGDAKNDQTHNPFIDSDPAKGVDARILEQWEQWFTLMDRHEILIYFEFYDDSARIWNTGDTVGAAEKAFFETIVRRFSHHRNLMWVIGEESDERYTSSRVRALAEVIRAADEHGHIIGDHHLSGATFRAWAPGSALGHFSMQLNVKPEAVHAGAVQARATAANRYQVVYAENTATPKDDDGMRRFAWAAATAGIMPMILQMDIAGTSEAALAQCRTLQRFFEATDYFRLWPHDELATGATRYVLAEPGRSYIAYADGPGELGVRGLPPGKYRIHWVDCRTGESVMREDRLEAGFERWARPASIGDECAAWIHFPEVKPAPAKSRADPTAQPVAKSAANRAPAVADRTVRVRGGAGAEVQLRFEDDDGPGPYAYTIVELPKHGQLSGSDNDRVYTPAAGFVGSDSFAWRVHDGVAESAVARMRLQVEK